MDATEKLARLLCVTEGYDPDIRVTQHVMMTGPKNSVILPSDDYYVVPAWALYRSQAQYMLEEASITYNEEAK